MSSQRNQQFKPAGHTRPRRKSSLLDLERLPSMAELLGIEEECQRKSLETRGTPGAAEGNLTGDEKTSGERMPHPPAASPLSLANMPSMEQLLQLRSGSGNRSEIRKIRGPDQEQGRRQWSRSSSVPRLITDKCRWRASRKTVSLPGPLVIDGSNICRREVVADYDRGEQGSSLILLLALLLFIAERRITFRCIFDASERFALARNPCWPRSAEIYRKLLVFAPDFFTEAPAGRSADELILELATRQGCPVVSNDRFNKLHDRHIERYPWLSAAGRRLIRAEYGQSGEVSWPRLGLRVWPGGDPEPLAEQLLTKIG